MSGRKTVKTVKTGPSIELPIKRKKEKKVVDEDEEQQLGGKKIDFENDNVLEKLEEQTFAKKPKKQPLKKKAEKKPEPSKPKLDPFSLQKDQVKLSGKDEYYGASDEESESEEKDKKEEKDSDEEDEEIPKKSNVMFIAHLPYGFFEEELKGFFGQYGEILKVVVRRNRITKNSMGYGYVKFKYADVAKIAADATNDYLFYGRRLVCEIATNPIGIFKEVDDLVPIDTAKINSEIHNRTRTPQEHQKRVSKLLRNEKKRKVLLEKLGYDFPGYQANLPKKSTHIVFENEEIDKTNNE